MQALYFSKNARAAMQALQGRPTSNLFSTPSLSFWMHATFSLHAFTSTASLLRSVVVHAGADVGDPVVTATDAVGAVASALHPQQA